MDGSLTDSCKQVADQISFRANLHSIPGESPCPVGFLAWPQAVAVVMFGSEHDVFSSRLFEKPCPVIRVEELGFELICELIVREASEFFPVKIQT